MGMKFLLLAFLLLLPTARAEIILETEGNCVDYNVSVMAEGIEDGCYDVKIDSAGGRVGKIYDPEKGWKSTFYYVEDGFCVKNGTCEKEFMLRAETYRDFSLVATLRSGSGKISSESCEVEQKCASLDLASLEYFFLFALVSVMLLVILLALYVKKTTL